MSAKIPPQAYQLLFENNMDAVLLTRPDGTILAANDAACQMFRMTEAEIRAAGRAGLMEVADPRGRDFIEERDRTGKARAELVHRRKDGTTFVGEVRSVIVEEGKSSFAIIRDITPQKEAEDALRRSEERFRTLTEKNPDIIGRFDRQHRHLYINPAAEAVSRRPASDFLGKTARELGLPPELCDRWEKGHDRAFRGERATMQYHLADAEGRQRYFWDMFLPEFGPDGCVESVLTICRDITELVETQHSLQETGLRLRLAQQAANLGVWEWDVERGETTATSECYLMWGIEPQRCWHDEEWSKRLHPDDAERVQRETEIFLQRGGRWQNEFRIVRPDAEVRWLLSLGQASRRKGGRVTAAVGCVIDITERKRAEEELRRAQEQASFIATALEKSSQPFAAGYPDGTLISFNPAFTALTGYSEEELRAASWETDLTPAEWRKPEDRVLRELHRSAAPQVYQKEYLRKDGSRVLVELKVHLARDGEGRDYYYSFVTDITERKRAEEALRKSEARYRGLFENNLIGTMVADTSGTVFDGNDAFLRLIGRKREDLPLNRSEFSDPAGYPNDEKALSELLQTGVARPHEKNYVRPDGRLVPVVAGASLLPEEEGVLVAFALDLTQEKRVQEELARRAAELEAVLDAIQGAVVVYDREGRAIRTNPAAERIFNVAKEASGSVEAAVERLKIRHLDGSDMLVPEFPSRRALAGEQVSCVLYRYTDSQGRERVGQGSATPLRVDGNIVGAVAVDDDVTEQVATEEALREAHRRKDEFLAMLSHELRNPLAPIRNSIYILRHLAPDLQGVRQAYQVIERQTEQLTRLVDDLLDVTRISRGKIKLDKSRIDLREVVHGAVEDFRDTLEQRGIALETVLPDRELVVEADRARLVQVLGNLLHNASKFTDQGGLVRVQLASHQGHAELSVADTGRGMKAKLLEQVFDIFVQGERTLARSEGGLGLGLALVKGITEMHGGTVRAASAGEGEGAEFVISLPLVEEPAARQVQPPEPAALKGRARVLVVDDNADAADSLASIVERFGYRVDVAYDGTSAVDSAQRHPPDIILCDVGLPGMSGYDVARQIRRERGDLVALVAITGYARPEDVLEALEAGFDAHVAKPVRINHLEQLFREMGRRLGKEGRSGE